MNYEDLIIIGLGLAFAISGIASMVLVFKIRSELLDAPYLVKFFGLYMLFPKYLSEKGKKYLVWSWRAFAASFIISLMIIVAMYTLVPEFSQEIDSINGFTGPR